MRQKSRRFFTESSHTWRPIVALTPTSGRGCKPTVELSSTGTESLSSSSLVFPTSCYTTDSWRPHRCCPLRKRLRTSTMGTWEGHRKHYIRYRKCPFPLKGSGPPRNTFFGPRAVVPPGFCNRGEVRYGSIGGLEYEVPQSRLYCLCINVALCSTALQCICRVIRRSSMTMKAHTFYIISGRPPIGGKLLPPPVGATVPESIYLRTASTAVRTFLCTLQG